MSPDGICVIDNKISSHFESLAPVTRKYVVHLMTREVQFLLSNEWFLMKTFLLSSWRPIFFWREGAGGSSLRLCQGLLFGVVALVDFEHCEDHHLTGHLFVRREHWGEVIRWRTMRQQTGSQWQECVPDSASRGRPSFSVTVSFAPRAANANSNWSRPFAIFSDDAASRWTAWPTPPRGRRSHPRSSLKNARCWRTAPAAGRTCPGSIPAAGEYFWHVHLVGSGGRTVNTERTGASFGETNACSMWRFETRCFFKVVSCVVCCAFLLGSAVSGSDSEPTTRKVLVVQLPPETWLSRPPWRSPTCFWSRHPLPGRPSRTYTAGQPHLILERPPPCPSDGVLQPHCLDVLVQRVPPVGDAHAFLQFQALSVFFYWSLQSSQKLPSLHLPLFPAVEVVRESLLQHSDA